MLAVILAAVAAFFSMATFGLKVAKQYAPPELPAPKAQPKPKPIDPYELIWWQDFSKPFSPEFEFRLANGETWRGHVSYRRYPDGAQKTDVVPHHRWDVFSALERRIGWKEPAIMQLHAHNMVGWDDAPDGAYTVKMLNGSSWKLQPDKPMNLRWRFVGADDTSLCHEPLVKVYESLDKHLATIQSFKETQAEAKKQLSARYGDGVIIQPACGKCGLTPVSIPGGICKFCRDAMGTMQDTGGVEFR